MSKVANYYLLQAISQQEFDNAMLLENTAIADHESDLYAEYKMQQRQEDAEDRIEHEDSYYRD